MPPRPVFSVLATVHTVCPPPVPTAGATTSLQQQGYKVSGNTRTWPVNWDSLVTINVYGEIGWQEYNHCEKRSDSSLRSNPQTCPQLISLKPVTFNSLGVVGTINYPTKSLPKHLIGRNQVIAFCLHAPAIPVQSDRPGAQDVYFITGKRLWG